MTELQTHRPTDQSTNQQTDTKVPKDVILFNIKENKNYRPKNPDLYDILWPGQGGDNVDWLDQTAETQEEQEGGGEEGVGEEGGGEEGGGGAGDSASGFG